MRREISVQLQNGTEKFVRISCLCLHPNPTDTTIVCLEPYNKIKAGPSIVLACLKLELSYDEVSVEPSPAWSILLDVDRFLPSFSSVMAVFDNMFVRSCIWHNLVHV
jgi:hypothetical protein